MYITESKYSKNICKRTLNWNYEPNTTKYRHVQHLIFLIPKKNSRLIREKCNGTFNNNHHRRCCISNQNENSSNWFHFKSTTCTSQTEKILCGKSSNDVITHWVPKWSGDERGGEKSNWFPLYWNSSILSRWKAFTMMKTTRKELKIEEKSELERTIKN